MHGVDLGDFCGHLTYNRLEGIKVRFDAGFTHLVFSE